jgi:hypothetical protein
MRRTRAILLGLFIASLALPPAAWAVTTVQGTDGAGYAGAAQKDATTVNAAHPTGQTRCIESARGYTMVTPSGQTVTMNSCATGTWSTTDIIPPPQYFLPGSITGLGTITTTATGSSTATGTYTITATATGTGTCAGTGTLTGTQTVSGTASATATGTGTKTVTATGIGTGSSTTTEMNISIGNASAAPGMFSLGSSGQAQFDSFGQLLLNRVITAGTSPLSIGSNVIGFNDRFGVYGSYGFAAKIGVTNGNIIFSTAPIGTYFTTVAETGRFAICQAGEIDIGNTTCGAYLLRVGASGTAGFDGSANVFANNINATPTASFIPQADTNHHIAIGWLPCTTSATPGGCPLADGTGKIDPSWIPPSSATSTSTATGTGNANFMAKWTTYTQTSTTTGTATITVTVTSLTNSTAYDNGNIGINKTNPATTLDVNGDVSANNITATPAANKVVKSRTTPATIDPAWLPGDRFVCGHGLDADVVCTASDVGADPVGAGTTAANAAVSGTTGQWAVFAGTNTVGNAPFTPMNGTVTHVSGDLPASTTHLSGDVPTTRNVSTTNGLQGGGDLSADRTLSPVYGTTANTVMQGNDSRVVNALQSLPLPYATATGALTGTGTGTATASTTATSTNTLTVTATVTGTFTAAGTGTITGTGTHTATGYATLTKTATGTVTATVTGTGTGTSTVTETNASIGNASAAPALLSIGTSGQAQFDPSGDLVSSGTLSINPASASAYSRFGQGGNSFTINNGAAVNLGFNLAFSDTWRFGIGSSARYGGALVFSKNAGSFTMYNTKTIGDEGAPATNLWSVFSVQANGNGLFAGTVAGTNLDTSGHGSADLLLPASGVCSAGQVLTYLSTGAPTCVTNGSGTGIGCSGSCSGGNFAKFTDSTHITNGAVASGDVTGALGYTPLNPASGVSTTCTKPTFSGGQATSCTSINSSDVITALGYTPGSGTGNVSTSGLTAGKVPKASTSTALVDSLLSESGTTETIAGSLVPDATGTRALGSSGAHWVNVYTNGLNLGGVNASSIGGTANAPVVSDGSGSLNSWVNGRLLAASSGSNGIDAPTDTFGNWTTVASTVISPTATATVVAHAMFTVGASGVTTCYMRLYDSVPAAPMGPENRFAAVGAGYAPMFNVASTTVAAGSHTIAAQLRAIAGSTCTVPANLSNLVVEVFQ